MTNTINIPLPHDYWKREGIDLSDEQVAYAALWRCYTDNPIVHEARMILLAKIGGQGSDAQRRALEWMAKVRPEEELHDNGYPEDETPVHIVEAMP